MYVMAKNTLSNRSKVAEHDDYLVKAIRKTQVYIWGSA